MLETTGKLETQLHRNRRYSSGCLVPGETHFACVEAREIVDEQALGKETRSEKDREGVSTLKRLRSIAWVEHAVSLIQIEPLLQPRHEHSLFRGFVSTIRSISP